MVKAHLRPPIHDFSWLNLLPWGRAQFDCNLPDIQGNPIASVYPGEPVFLILTIHEICV